MDTQSKIIPLDALGAWRSALRADGRRLVVTNGVFDLMHRGHATYLAQAADLGDALLVLINDDESVTALKGPTRPIQPAADRAFLLAALECVAAVCIFHGKRATDALRLAAPDVYVKGGDYTPQSLDRDEFAALQAVGAEIRILPLQPGCSTTAIVNRILEQKTEFGDSGQRLTLDERLNPIFARRSVRKFRAHPVEQPMIASLLEAAMAAPSARATYPAEFIVLTERQDLKRVADCLPNGRFLADAPLGIVICGDLSRACHGELSYMLQDCSACMENLLVAARMLRLGACWLGVHPNVERIAALRKLFALPDGILPVAAAAIGYPLEELPPPRTRFTPEQVHLNQW